MKYILKFEKTVKIVAFVVLGSFVLALSFSHPVNAVEYGGIGGKPANPDPGNPRTESIFIYTLNPGETKKDGVLVVNNTQETKTMLVYSTDSQKSTDGAFACEQFSDTKEAVGNWITLEKDEVTLEPLTSEIVNFTITAPENASVGEQNGCVMMQEKKDLPSDASGVTLTFRTGLRVAVTIPGEKVRKLKLISFELKRNLNDLFEGETKSDNALDKSDTTYPKNKLKSRIKVKNEGNVSIDTTIKLEMKYIFGINYFSTENRYPILRDDTSTYNFEIPKPFWGGFYKVSSSAEYDSSSDASVGIDTANPKTKLDFDSKIIFIFPDWKALLLEFAMLGILVSIVYYIYITYKKRIQIATTWVKRAVKSGEDINSIAQQYSISWKSLARANKLKPPYLLKQGQIIKVPPRSKSII